MCLRVHTCARTSRWRGAASSLSLAQDPQPRVRVVVGEGGEARKGLSQGRRCVLYGDWAATSPNGNQTVLQQLPSVRPLANRDASLLLFPQSGLGIFAFFHFWKQAGGAQSRERFFISSPNCLETCPPPPMMPPYTVLCPSLPGTVLATGAFRATEPPAQRAGLREVRGAAEEREEITEGQLQAKDGPSTVQICRD